MASHNDYIVQANDCITISVEYYERLVKAEREAAERAKAQQEKPCDVCKGTGKAPNSFYDLGCGYCGASGRKAAQQDHAPPTDGFAAWANERRERPASRSPVADLWGKWQTEHYFTHSMLPIANEIRAALTAQADYLRTMGANANYDDPWQTGYREGCLQAARIILGGDK